MLHTGDFLLFFRAEIQYLNQKHPPDTDAVRQHFNLINMNLSSALHHLFHIRLCIRHIHILIYGNLYIFFQL